MILSYSKKYIVASISVIFFCALFFAFPTTAQAKTKVAFIGSSSFARGCNASYGFIKLLQKEMGETHEFHCKGTTQGSMGHAFFLDKWKNDVKGKGFDELFLYAGLNGIGSSGGLKNYKKNQSIIIDEAKAEGIKVIVVGGQPFKGWSTWNINWQNNVYENNAFLSAQANIYIDMAAAVDKDKDNAIDAPYFTKPDHLHLNAEGNKLTFDLIKQQVYSGAAATFTSNGVPLFKEVSVELLSPEPRIGIPGLVFSKISDIVQIEEDGKKYAVIPFLGEYLSAIYRWGIIIIGILAVIMVMIGGVQWILSGGSSDRVTAAKKRITNAVIAIIIAVGSYTLLYTINPDLVNLRNVKLLTVQGLLLEAIDRGTPIDFSKLGTASKSLADPKYDALFQKYASCTGAEWQVLKAIAYTESRYNESVVNSIGFTGLFQTKKPFCESALGKYGLQSKCTDLKNAEVSTMVGAAMLRTSINNVKKYCGSTDGNSKLYFMYLGHHSGHGTQLSVLRKNCSYVAAKPLMHEFWSNRKCKGGVKCYADSSGNKRTAKHISSEGDAGAKGVMKRALKLGATGALQPIDKAKCPLENHSLISS